MKNTSVSLVADTRKWYLIDADYQTLGRLATIISIVIRGKHKSGYLPYSSNGGDFIVVINAKDVRVTGKKEKQKKYTRHSGYPGGLKMESFKKLNSRFPNKIIEKAVKGMLPKGPLGRTIFKNLKVYAGSVHPHESQKPQLLTNR
jgi:large subunit ribosomal protein L13